MYVIKIKVYDRNKQRIKVIKRKKLFLNNIRFSMDLNQEFISVEWTKIGDVDHKKLQNVKRKLF